MRDITANHSVPYTTNGLEGLLGLFDANDQVKPGLVAFQQFARRLQADPTPPPLPEDTPTAIGLYSAKHYYSQGDAENPGNMPSVEAGHATTAYHLLRLLNLTGSEIPRVVRGDLPLPTAGTQLRTLVVTSSILVPEEVAALAKWVEDGGHLLWHGLRPGYESAETAKLLGCRIGNASTPTAARTLELAGTKFAFGSKSDTGARLTLLPDAKSSTKVWRFGSGEIALLHRKVGQGKVLAAVAAVEAEPLAAMGDRAPRDAWASFYKAALQLLEPSLLARAQAPAPLRAPRPLPELREPDDSGQVALTSAWIYSSTASTAKTAEQTLKAIAPAVTTKMGLPDCSDGCAGSVAIVPSQPIVLLPDIETLAQFVGAGGCLLWHGITSGHWSPLSYDLWGAAAVDVRSPLPFGFRAFGRSWSNISSSWSDVNVEVSTEDAQRPGWGTATVLAHDARGIPTLTK